MDTCKFESCGREHRAGGWCNKHYQQWNRYGEVWAGGVRQKSWESRFWSKVDKSESDACWNWLGQLTSHGYGNLRLGNKMEKAHRLSYQLFTGTALEPQEIIDHQCRNRACVNPRHLLKCTQSENTQTSPVRSDNTTGFKGVSLKEGRYRARVTVQGKVHYVGVFDTAQEAGEAAKKARIRLQTNNLPDFE